MQLKHLFDKKMRALKCAETKKWWISAVDFCALLKKADYDTARNYWKKYKHELLNKNQQLYTKICQLKMPAKDGKMRYTDVIDFETAIVMLKNMRKKPETYFFLNSERKIENFLTDISYAYKNLKNPFMRITTIKKFRIFEKTAPEALRAA